MSHQMSPHLFQILLWHKNIKCKAVCAIINISHICDTFLVFIILQIREWNWILDRCLLAYSFVCMLISLSQNNICTWKIYIFFLLNIEHITWTEDFNELELQYVCHIRTAAYFRVHQAMYQTIETLISYPTWRQWSQVLEQLECRISFNREVNP